MPRRTPLVAVLALALGAAACSTSDQAQPRPTDPGATTTVQLPTPVFDQATCQVVKVPGISLTCGYVTVPADRTAPRRGSVRLAVGRVAPAQSADQGGPVVVLPAAAGLASLRDVGRWLDHPLRQRHEIILIDLRGTGFSEPSLDCPEYDRVVWQNAQTADPASDERDRALEAIAQCRRRMQTQEIDPSLYTTAANAADVDAVRQALGFTQWDVYAEGYGTTLALELMRSYPAGLRSAVLDSVLPTTATESARERFDLANRAFFQLYGACAAQKSCNDTNPNLLGTVSTVVIELDREPFKGDVNDPIDGRARSVTVTGADFIRDLAGALAAGDLIPQLPDLLTQASRRNVLVFQALASRGAPLATGLAEGAALSVSCADRAGRLDVAALENTVQQYPAYSTLLYAQPLELACWQQWQVPPMPDTFADPVTSPVPALVLSGDYDPTSSPEIAATVAAQLGNAVAVTFPGLARRTVLADCPRQITESFLASPDPKALDVSCAAAMRPPAFT